MNAPGAMILDGSRLITQDFTIGDITGDESVAVVNRGDAVLVRSLDGEVLIPFNMITEVAGAMIAIVLR